VGGYAAAYSPVPESPQEEYSQEGYAPRGEGGQAKTEVIVPGGREATLEHIYGTQQGRIDRLSLQDAMRRPTRNVIGRNPDCTITITGDRLVSGRHCEIALDDDGNLYVADLNSSNGTFVLRGQMQPWRVTSRFFLMDNDVLRIGNTLLKLRVTELPRGKYG